LTFAHNGALKNLKPGFIKTNHEIPHKNVHGSRTGE
jgi:hypothetical protein